jgi:RNA polymerase sigma-70 factor, ECF subfamily
VIKSLAAGHPSGAMVSEAARLPLGVPRASTTTDDSVDRLAAIFHQHYDFVWRSVRRLGVPPDGVDDAAQEVFVVVSRRLDAIERGKEKAFLFGTAMRVAADARRARARRRQSPDEAPEPADASPAPDELVDRKRARELLDELVAQLPDDTRPVFVLFELEGMTMAEIAAVLELAPGTVASRLRRAREVFAAFVARRDAAQGGDRG